MRIIGGKNKGKILAKFDLDNIRPTSDIVKEAVFNTLQFDIANSVFLDLFGGTGSVGLEALSRGAKSVYICDSNKNSINLIKKNNDLIKGNAIIIHNSFEKALLGFKDINIKFDIVFIDPPYNTQYGEQAINLIAEYELLSNDGIVVFEHHKDKPYIVHEKYELINSKKYGIKAIEYLQLKQ